MTKSVDDTIPWLNGKEMEAWRAYIVGSALLTYRLSRELQTEHGLSIADYEILVHLSEQPKQRMRMTELAASIAHSKSRISHQVRRLSAKELVQRQECPSDGRGVFALLTDKGAELLRQAAPTHLAGVRKHMVDMLEPDEQEALASVFERITTHLRSIDD